MFSFNYIILINRKIVNIKNLKKINSNFKK